MTGYKGNKLGLLALTEMHGLELPHPASQSFVVASARKTERDTTGVKEYYPSKYARESAVDHLVFALKNEPLDLRVWHAIMMAIERSTITRWVVEQPISAYARRTWYLYETLTRTHLPLPDLDRGNYADLADPEKQITWGSHKSLRHRITDNLGIHRGWCPLVRLTPKIKAGREAGLREAASRIAQNVSPELFARVARYLYLSETKSSYALENETPDRNREAKFVSLLERAGQDEVFDEAALTKLQALIVQDSRFVATGWRTIQNYVGRTRLNYEEEVVYPCPRPQDVPNLMAAWMNFASGDSNDEIALAAAVAFGFVYLHPFLDGNGRLHRFLIHHILGKNNFTPKGVILPVSAAILRHQDEYDRVLRSVSSIVTPFVDFLLNDRNEMDVRNETVDLYRYPDLTPHVEFLYECLQETIEKDWPNELNFLKRFDAASNAVQSVVDMPDPKLRLLVKLILQNQGKLAQGKRKLFDFVTDDELSEIESRLAAVDTEFAVL